LVVVSLDCFWFYPSTSFNSPKTQYILGAWSGITWFSNFAAIVTGVVELVAVALLLLAWQPWAALQAFEILCAAITFHLLTPLCTAIPV